MSQVLFDYKKERSGLFIKYGVELDETSSIVLFILREEQKSFFEQQRIKLQEVAAKINSSNNSLEVDHSGPRSQAFWFGMGKWGVALLIATSIASIFYSYHLSKQSTDRKILLQVSWYKAYYKVSKTGSKKAVEEFIKKYPIPEE